LKFPGKFPGIVDYYYIFVCPKKRKKKKRCSYRDSPAAGLASIDSRMEIPDLVNHNMSMNANLRCHI